jgi:hypothetical protein
LYDTNEILTGKISGKEKTHEWKGESVEWKNKKLNCKVENKKKIEKC